MLSLFSGSSGARAAQQATDVQELAGLKAKREVEQGFGQAGEQLQAGVSGAQDFLSPFAQVGQNALAQQNLLTDPNAQFQWLQNNPLFQASLSNANNATMGSAAARGRLTAGDTQTQLANNTLLAAQPLLAQQQANIQQGLGFGANIAGQQAGLESGLGANLANLSTGQATTIADLLTSIGAAQAGGIVGAENARAQGRQNFANFATGLLSMGISGFGGKK